MSDAAEPYGLLQRVFEAARALRGAERREVLARRCDDAEFRERRAVAGSMQSAQDFLERGEPWKAACLFRRVVGENRVGRSSYVLEVESGGK